MKTIFTDLYNEIVMLVEDLENFLKNRSLSTHVKQLAEKELDDLLLTLEKMEQGSYGICEETGKPIPFELLYFQPTIRSFHDVEVVNHYFRKPVYP